VPTVALGKKPERSKIHDAVLGCVWGMNLHLDAVHSMSPLGALGEQTPLRAFDIHLNKVHAVKITAPLDQGI